MVILISGDVYSHWSFVALLLNPAKLTQQPKPVQSGKLY